MNEKVSPETDVKSASRGAWVSWVGWFIALACVAGALVLAGYQGLIPGIAGAAETSPIAATELSYFNPWTYT